MEQRFPTAKGSHTALCLALLSPRGEVLKIRPFLDNVEESAVICVLEKLIILETWRKNNPSSSWIFLEITCWYWILLDLALLTSH